MKQSYVPSPYTLSVLDNYGARGLESRFARTKVSEHYLRSEANVAGSKKHAFDKENLLEQIRLQKKRMNLMSTVNLQLHRTLERTKVKVSLGKGDLRGQGKKGCIAGSLKREVELLVEQLQRQQTQIRDIKTSKKYNRFLELKMLKQVYEAEIRSVRGKIRGLGHAMRERRRVWTSHKNREKGVREMSKAVQRQIILQNNALLEQIQELKAKNGMEQLKRLNLKRQKERILRDILELQKKTGKLYVIREVQKEEPPQQEQIDRLQQKYSGHKPTRSFEESEDYSEQQQDDSLDQDGQQQESQEDGRFKRSLSRKSQRLNISF